MASKRDCINNIVNYLENLDITVNIAKNKAKGHKGFFVAKNGRFRIDISKEIDEDSILRVLVHEFGHYLHFINDKSLNSLDFILNKELTDEILEEYISTTVNLIPKNTIKPLFDLKEKLKSEVNSLKNLLESSKNFVSVNELEKKICKTEYKYLLRTDNVKVLDLFRTQIYSINDLENYNLTSECKSYIRLKSRQRALKRLNSKISKLNKYYNSPSELFARSLEMYLLNNETFRKKAVNLSTIYDNVVKNKKYIILNELIDIIDNKY